MKKTLVTIITLTTLFASSAVGVFAATASISATPKKTIDTKIEDLKERLATKVAELRKTTPRATYGTVTQVSLSSVTVDTSTKAIKIELTDNIKVYQVLKGKRTTLTTDNVEKNDHVTIFGDYDSTLDVLQAKIIYIESPTQPVRINGQITAIDKKNGTFTLTTQDNTAYTVDVGTLTKTSSWTKGKGVEKSGFSKLVEGQFASVYGTAGKQSTDIGALRILFFSTDQPSPTLAPTVAATPSATIKPTPTTKAKITPTVKPTP